MNKDRRPQRPAKVTGTRPPKGQGKKEETKRPAKKAFEDRSAKGYVQKQPQKQPAKQVQPKGDEPKYSGEMDKAYNILAKQLKISGGKAKEMIDRGLVYSRGKKILIARAAMPIETEFKVEKLQKPRTIFENKDLIVVDKPPFMTSDEVEAAVGATLVHRLDKETSGVLALAKNEETLKAAIDAFKKRDVYKEYVAIVSGVIAEGGIVDVPLLIKKGTNAKATVDKKFGKSAKTIYEPLEMIAKKTKLKVVIETGRTHQIRAHMKFLKHPIVGDAVYGGSEAKRMMLHSKVLRLLGHEFTAEEPKDFMLKE